MTSGVGSDDHASVTADERAGGGETSPRGGVLPPLARGPVLAIAAGVGLVLLVTSGRYGYFHDELYFIAAGWYPDWGYADQPPLLPLLASALDSLFGGSVVGLRLPATVLAAAGVVVTALITRELGGRRRAQLLAAAVYAPIMLAFGHVLTTVTVDLFAQTVLVWLLVRWVRLRDDRLLLWAGSVTALALQAKYLIVFVWLALAISALVAGPRELLRRPLLWLGGVVAVLTAVPALLWQARNGWPQLDMAQAIAEQHQAIGMSQLLLPVMGFLMALVLHCYGLWRLLRSPELRSCRFFGWAFVGLGVFFFFAYGRYDYLHGFFALLWAVAAVELQRRRPARWWRWVPTWPVCVLSAVVGIAMALPVYPVSWLSRMPNGMVNVILRDSVGWPELVDTVAGVYYSLPSEVRRGAVVVANDYPEAGAVAALGPERGVPAVYSGHRGMWYFGPPPEDSGVVIFVGPDPGYLRQDFAQVRQVATTDNGLGLGSMSQGLPVWVCEGRRAPWSQLWPHYRHLHFSNLSSYRKQ